MKVRVLASGSKGNCILVSGQESAILVDAGLSLKRLKEKLFDFDFPLENIKALVISHEHTDHIKGAGPIVRSLGIPIYINESTYNAGAYKLGNIKEVKIFDNGTRFTMSEFLVEPFSVPHDSADTSCFLISERGNSAKLAVLTDLGYPTSLVKEKMKTPSTIILESNHDIDMLVNGPYAWHLKQRVKGKHGHLSNVQASELIDEVLHDGLKNIILAHLSEINNVPDLAIESMRSFLKSRNASCNLYVAGQHQSTDWIEV